LPLPILSLGQLVQPLNKGFVKNFVTVASSNLNVALEDPTVRQIALRTQPGGGQGSHHQGGPGSTLSPQGGSQHDGLARGVHVPFDQECRAQVRGRNGLDDDGACLLRKGVSGLIGDLEA
jgi:hypothetical protein